jgi:hypothetical protein
MLNARSDGGILSASKELAWLRSQIPVLNEASIQDANDDALVPVVNRSGISCAEDGTALVTYLLDSEVHTFAFSVAANAILSFIPFASCCCIRWRSRCSTRKPW